ncbi:terpene synthase family protein [Pendulispora albinea]|uniref:Terpene synthase n=1 Tax=Pendulispora albinea TaxID=2741071 RepID=A0ABZ2MAN9_9BACT
MEDVPERIFSIFEPQTNPYIESARAHLDDWVAELRLVRKKASEQRFARADFAGFASITYPSADEAGAHLISDWFAWLFLVDDELDDGVFGRDLERVERVMGDIIATLRATDEPAAGPGEGPRAGAVEALADLWRRTIVGTSPSWRRRFVQHVFECFAAASWEAKNRVEGRIPTEREYIDKRRHTGAIYVCMDLIEVVEELELASEVCESKVFQEALDAACNVVCWTNDVYSLDKERGLGEYHNLVYLVEHARGLSTREADDAVWSAIAAEVRSYLEREQELFAAFPEHGAALSAYAAGMRSWMRGNYDWSRKTYRYRDPREERPEQPAVYLEPTLTGGA